MTRRDEAGAGRIRVWNVPARRSPYRHELVMPERTAQVNDNKISRPDQQISVGPVFDDRCGVWRQRNWCR